MGVDTKKVIPFGDKDKSLSMVHLVNRQIALLKNQMSFNDLKQYSNVWQYPNGAYVKCSSVYGQVTVDVFSPVKGTVEETKKALQEIIETDSFVYFTTKCKNHVIITHTNDLSDDLSIQALLKILSSELNGAVLHRVYVFVGMFNLAKCLVDTVSLEEAKIFKDDFGDLCVSQYTLYLIPPVVKDITLKLVGNIHSAGNIEIEDLSSNTVEFSVVYSGSENKNGIISNKYFRMFNNISITKDIVLKSYKNNNFTVETKYKHSVINENSSQDYYTGTPPVHITEETSLSYVSADYISWFITNVSVPEVRAIYFSGLISYHYIGNILFTTYRVDYYTADLRDHYISRTLINDNSLYLSYSSSLSGTSVVQTGNAVLKYITCKAFDDSFNTVLRIKTANKMFTLGLKE